MKRQGKRDRFPRAVLLLRKMKPFAPQMLAPEKHNVRAPLPRVEQECQRKAGLRAHRMECLESCDFLFGPRMEALGVAFQILHILCRVFGCVPVFDGEGVELPKCLDQRVGGFRPIGFGSEALVC